MKRNRVRAVMATCALAGSGLGGLAVAGPASAATAGVGAVFVQSQGVLTVSGSSADDRIVVSRDAAGNVLVNGGAVPIQGGAPTVGNVELIRVFGNNGNDALSVDETNGPLPRAELFGGAGNDRIAGGSAADLLAGGDGDDALFGGSGAEQLVGGNGNDFVDGNGGADTVLLGNGDDTFQWDPGDGSDVVEGGAGFDSMIFNGSNGAETFDVSANAGRVLYTRSLGAIRMDLHGVERIVTNAFGGADAFTAHDLTGTDVTDLQLDEAATSGTPDFAADRTTIDGTAGSDVISVSGTSADGVTVTGLHAAVQITGTDPTDSLDIDAGAGDDAVIARNLAGGVVTFSADGGAGNDLLIGSAGADVLHGGDGNDVLVGGPGKDVLDGGAGTNLLIQ
jgi:Ca2+-binding RTX toxin-like protein